LGQVQPILADTLMDPAFSVYGERCVRPPDNLEIIYGMGAISCDTSMWEIDNPGIAYQPLRLGSLRPVQWNKVLEPMVFKGEGYLLNLDGTGVFSRNSMSVYTNDLKGRRTLVLVWSQCWFG
jgi:hypothetical protein